MKALKPLLIDAKPIVIPRKSRNVGHKSETVQS
jgi:hypothetical protein